MVFHSITAKQVSEELPRITPYAVEVCGQVFMTDYRTPDRSSYEFPP